MKSMIISTIWTQSLKPRRQKKNSSKLYCSIYSLLSRSANTQIYDSSMQPCKRSNSIPLAESLLVDVRNVQRLRVCLYECYREGYSLRGEISLAIIHLQNKNCLRFNKRRARR